MGITMSATEVNSLMKSAYEYVLGTSSTVTGVESLVTSYLLKEERVNEVFKYKED